MPTFPPQTNKKLYIDIGVSSTSSTLNEKLEIDNEIVDHITNADLKSLRIRNLNKTVVGHLNINLIRNKFDFLAHQVKGNIDILITNKHEQKLINILENQKIYEGFLEILIFRVSISRTYLQRNIYKEPIYSITKNQFTIY